MFRDPIKLRVEFGLRNTTDLRAPRDRHRYQRAVEQRKILGRELPPLGRGPLDAPMNDPAYLAPYTDIDEGKEERYESDESYYGVGATFRG